MTAKTEQFVKIVLTELQRRREKGYSIFEAACDMSIEGLDINGRIVYPSEFTIIAIQKHNQTKYRGQYTLN